MQDRCPVQSGLTAATHRTRLIAAVQACVEPIGTEARVAATLSGAPTAARSLVVATDNARRGELAVLCWQARIPLHAYRQILSSVWGHDHGYLIHAARHRRRLRAMFEYAEFPPAHHLPPVITVYRGTAGIPLCAARRGFSWTLDRQIASWFAVRFAGDGRKPLVVKAEVPRERVALYNNDRDEQEVVLFDVKTADADGTVTEWGLEFEAQQQRHKRDIEGMRARYCASA